MFEAARAWRAASGVPYTWGGGRPDSVWPTGAVGLNGGRPGWDCSGFAQALAVRIGRLGSGAPDRSAAGLEAACDVVQVGKQRDGDFAFYGRERATHICVVVGAPRADGHSAVVGANGGGSRDSGENPRAFVRHESTARYRRDFRGYGRLRPSETYLTSVDVLAAVVRELRERGLAETVVLGRLAAAGVPGTLLEQAARVVRGLSGA